MPAPVMPEAEGRAMVMHRALGMCEVQVVPGCRQGEPEWHHRQSRRADDHRPSNGLAVCRPCHNWLHAHPREAVAHGWIVLVAGNLPPAEVAVLLHPRGTGPAVWVNLSPGGTYV